MQRRYPSKKRPIDSLIVMQDLGITPIDLLGFAAGAAVVATFWMREPVWLRSVGILSNTLFISYGVLVGLAPIYILHGILLPLNCARLIEITGLDLGSWDRDRRRDGVADFPFETERRRLFTATAMGMRYRAAPGVMI